MCSTQQQSTLWDSGDQQLEQLMIINNNKLHIRGSDYWILYHLACDLVS